MTRDEAVTRIIQRLGKRVDLQTTIETEIVNVQTDVLEGNEWLPWFLMSGLEDLATVADTQEVAVPTGFLSEDEEEGALWRYDASNTDNVMQELKKDDVRILVARHPGSGIPLSYALRGEQFLLFPTPDAIYPLKLACYLRDAPLTSNITNLWLTHAATLVIEETCYLVATEIMKDLANAPVFRTAADKAWAKLYKRHIARREAGGMRMMGED